MYEAHKIAYMGTELLSRRLALQSKEGHNNKIVISLL
jgi:hypothetical protein